MRLVIIIAVIFFTVACNQTEFEVPNDNSVMSAYIENNFWAADSLPEAYYFKNTLYIAAKGENEGLILKIDNPVIGNNNNVDFEYHENVNGLSTPISSAKVKVYLNVLDTLNALPSIINGSFSGQVELADGRSVDIKDGKINRAVTSNLFCENSIRSYSTNNTDIGGQWELVRIVNRRNGNIQNPTCHSKVFMDFYNENYEVEKIAERNSNFVIKGPKNSLWGNFDLLEETHINFIKKGNTETETSLYNEYLEKLVFSCVTGSSEVFINNTLMHLESADYICVFYRKP